MGTHLHDIQEFCLKWNNHHTTIVSVLDTLLEKESLCDVTLAAEGQFVRVHRFVLFACSSYFEELLSQQVMDNQSAAVVFLKDVKFTDVKAIVDFMYKGQVNVSQLQLESFLQTAEALQIKGLADKPDQHKYMTDMATKPSSISNSNAIKQSNGGSRRAEKRPRTSSSTGINKKSQLSENSKQPAAMPPCPPLRLQRSRLSTTAAVGLKTTKQTAAAPVIAQVVATTQQQQKKKTSDVLTPVVAVVQIEKEEDVSEEEVIDNEDDDDEPPQLDKLDWITPEDNNQSNEEEDEEDEGSQQGENGADTLHAGDSAGPNGGLSILEDFEDIERPFVCPRCRRRYKRKNNAVSHLRHECGIEPSFPCPICSHLLSQRRYIQKHIRRKHPQYLREYEEQLLKQRNNADANDEANDY